MEPIESEGPVEGSGLLRVTGYLPVDDRLEGRLDRLRECLAALREEGLPTGDGALSLRWVEDEDWAHAWKSFFHPFRVGRRFVIRPTWEEWHPAVDDRVLAIDPGMAFGTGAHPTTQLCLELIEERVRAGSSVLDVGTGSGILAIAAASLGATPIVGIDVDPVAVAAARENLRANPDAAGVVLVVGEASAVPCRYDWVFANLIADTIQDQATLLASRLAPGGALIASGIIAERAGDVQAALSAAGLVLEAERGREGWVALVARRREGR